MFLRLVWWLVIDIDSERANMEEKALDETFDDEEHDREADEDEDTIAVICVNFTEGLRGPENCRVDDEEIGDEQERELDRKKRAQK